jgi:hypothetical protein
MPLAKAAKPVRQENQKPRWLSGWLVLTLATLGTAMPAWSECLSPSAEAGATTTTVYRCPEGNASAGQQPLIVEPGKTTTVERGSAEIPWFEPKPTKTTDPIAMPKATPQKAEEDKVKAEPVPAKSAEPTVIPPPKAEAKAPVAEPEAAAADAKATVDTEPTAAKPKAKAAEAKLTKVKRTKVKLAKAKRSKAKLAKAKRTKPKLAQEKRTKAKTKTVKTQPTPEQQVKTEPAKADDKVIVMTKKDVPLGGRIKNWLGF